MSDDSSEKERQDRLIPDSALLQPIDSMSFVTYVVSLRSIRTRRGYDMIEVRAVKEHFGEEIAKIEFRTFLTNAPRVGQMIEVSFAWGKQ